MALRAVGVLFLPGMAYLDSPHFPGEEVIVFNPF